MWPVSALLHAKQASVVSGRPPSPSDPHDTKSMVAIGCRFWPAAGREAARATRRSLGQRDGAGDHGSLRVQRDAPTAGAACSPWHSTPNYASNARYYVYYTPEWCHRHRTLQRFGRQRGRRRPDRHRVAVDPPQAFNNHKGGLVALFGRTVCCTSAPATAAVAGRSVRQSAANRAEGTLYAALSPCNTHGLTNSWRSLRSDTSERRGAPRSRWLI